MVEIKHSVISVEPNDATKEVSSTAWNDGHTPGTIADVLTDHDKAAHDALLIDADTLDTQHAAEFAPVAHVTVTTNPHSTSDANLVVTDVVTNNVSNTKHGFVPKATDVVAHFLRADGTWDAPAGAGDMTKVVYDGDDDGIVDQADLATAATDSDTVDGSHAADFAPAAQGVTSGNAHDHTGGDGGPILESSITLADNVTLNVSNTKHGLVPKCTDVAGQYLNASGAYSAPAGAGDMLKAVYDVGDLGTVDEAIESDTLDGNHAAAFAVTAKGVTNGDTHDHSGGDGAAIVEAAITLADNVTNNCSTTKHGFLKKLDNTVTHYMDGTGLWSTPVVSALGEPAFPKFTVVKVGANYHVIDEYGELTLSTASFEVAMNDEAFAGLTGGRTVPETIVTRGEIIVDDPILIPSFVKIIIDGKWTLDANVDDNMIENANPAANNIGVIIEGLGHAVIDGNGANQAGGTSIIDFENSTNPESLFDDNGQHWGNAFQMRNLTVKKGYKHNIQVDFESSSYSQIGFFNVSSFNQARDSSASHALDLAYVNDSYIEGGNFCARSDVAGSYAINALSISTMKIHPHYLNGPSQIYGGNSLDITCSDWCDNYAADHSFTFGSFYNNKVHDMTIRRFDNGEGADNTYDGINLADIWGGGYDCHHNIFSTIHFLHSTHQHRYGIYETDANQDYNVYNGIIDVGACGTAAIRQLGANSDYGHIIGTVVTV